MCIFIKSVSRHYFLYILRQSNRMSFMESLWPYIHSISDYLLDFAELILVDEIKIGF